MNDGGRHVPGAPPWPARPGEQPASAADSPPAAAPEQRSPALQYQRIALVDLLDRLLAGGVVVSGEVRLAIADVDLVTISLRALIASASSVAAYRGEEDSRDP